MREHGCVALALVACLGLGPSPAWSKPPPQPKSAAPPGSREVPGTIPPPTTGPDTYVSISSPVQSGKAWSVFVTVGNASQITVANVVAKLRVSSRNGVVCEATSPPLYVIKGESLKMFGVHASDSPLPGPQAGGSYTIEVEASYLNYQTSQVEQNTANNRQVATFSIPGTPRCLSAVSFKDELYPVFAHYRCINCHGRVDPLAARRHMKQPNCCVAEITQCRGCHNVEKWTNVGVPVFWTLSDQIYTPVMICGKVKDNSVSRQKLYDHLTKDPRMVWAFHPSSHQISPKGPAPGTHPAFVANMMSWFDSGKPCPAS